MANESKLNITVPAGMADASNDAAGSGEYASSNEVVREAFRRIVHAARNLADLF